MGLNDIKKLRDLTSLGINDCKKALSESGGDFDKALQILKDKGIQALEKRSSRLTRQGLIEAYIHFAGNLGVLVEVNCETDFVARTEIFKKFAKDMAMQVAACSPQYLSQQDIPSECLRKVKDKGQYLKQNCLMEQPFVNDESISVADYLRAVAAQTGEKVAIKRFVRFALGESE